jgi:hypothetical protein
MYNDCLLIKAHKIDEKTKSEIQKNNGIVLAADAQDPGSGMNAIWLFTDCLSGRVFHTQQTNSMPAEGDFSTISQNQRRFK